MSTLTELEIPSNRSFGLTFTGIFSVVGLWPLLDGGMPRIWAMGAALAVFAATFVYPKILSLPNQAWTRFGMIAGRITNPVVLALLFFIFLTPIGLGMRIAGRDLLQLRKRRNQETYWTDKSDAPAPAPMTRQF